MENLMDEIDRLKGALKPPVVCMWHEMADINLDNFTCWVGDMTLRGVVKWVMKPFPSSGRTPDRMLKKVRNGQYTRVVKATPLTPIELMAAPLGGDGELEIVPPRSQPREHLVIGPLLNAENYLPAMDPDAIAAKLGKMFGKVRIGNADDAEPPNAAGASSTAESGASTATLAKSDVPPLTARPKRGSTTTTPAATTTAVIATPTVATTATAAAAAAPTAVATATAVAPDNGRWPNIPNEPITLDDFMAKFCEPRSKENRKHRKQALLAAARNETVTLPPLAGTRKHGMPNRYLTHDLLAVWPNFLDEGVDLPPLLPQFTMGTNGS